MFHRISPKTTDFISNLPEEILTRCLCHLDAESLSYLTTISKRFKELIEQDYVWQKSLNDRKIIDSERSCKKAVFDYVKEYNLFFRRVFENFNLNKPTLKKRAANLKDKIPFIRGGNNTLKTLKNNIFKEERRINKKILSKKLNFSLGNYLENLTQTNFFSVIDIRFLITANLKPCEKSLKLIVNKYLDNYTTPHLMATIWQAIEIHLTADCKFDINYLNTILRFKPPFNIIQSIMSSGIAPNEESLKTAIECKASFEIIELIINSEIKPHREFLRAFIKYSLNFSVGKHLENLAQTTLLSDTDICFLITAKLKPCEKSLKLIVNKYLDNHTIPHLTVAVWQIIGVHLIANCKFDISYLNTILRFEPPFNIIQSIISSGIQPNEESLKIAIECGASFEIIELIINSEIKPDRESLKTAIKYGASFKVIELIIKSGVQPDKESLKVASEKVFYFGLELIMQSNFYESKDSMCSSFYGNFFKIIQLIINSGVDPDENCLCHSLFYKAFEIVELIINSGVQSTQKSLEWALRQNHSFEIIQSVINSSIQRDVEYLNTALVNNASFEIIEFIINLGIQPDKESLKVALRSKASFEIIQLIINSGVRPDRECLLFSIKYEVPLNTLRFIIESGVQLDLECLKESKYSSSEIISLIKIQSDSNIN